MGRRKKKLPLYENLTITDFAAEGKALTRVDEMVLFVPYLAPGDIADIQVTKKRKSYMEGVSVNIHKLSQERTKPVCPHFGVCGGCKWQHLQYERQLFYKQKQVLDTMEKFSKIQIPIVENIKGAELQYCYRNKNEYTFSSNRWLTNEEIQSQKEIDRSHALGFHIPGRFDRILDIEVCYLQDSMANQIRDAIKKYTTEHDYTFYNQNTNEGLLRNLIIRNSSLNEVMVIMIFGYEDQKKISDLMFYIEDRFPHLTSLLYVINKKLNTTIHDLKVNTYAGRDFLYEEIDGVRFKIGPKSFFQTNTEQAKILYRETKELALLNKNDIVYDLYTGTGTIANYIAKDVKKVIGIEYVAEAIEDAHINSKLNKNKNTHFVAGDMKDIFTDDFISEHGNPDVIITDPPRAGMHTDVVNAILHAKAKRIVYVSCNPATQARDLALLGEKYKVTTIQPVDMFPHTHHVENIVAMELREAQG